MRNFLSLTSKQLKQAASIKDKIVELEHELLSLLGGAVSSFGEKLKKKGGMSAAGRAKVAAAQRARWAKFKATTKTVVTKKSKMSKSARAKIAAAQKARWAKVKAAKT